MSARDTGGPAFPGECGGDPATNEHQTGNHTWQQYGMTLRDYFAAKAMNSIMDGSWPDFQICPRNGEDIAQCTARNAYEYADAMLEARK